MGRNAGIHPDNRANAGVDPFNAQNLAVKISLQGYSESKLESPIGFEPAASAWLRFKQQHFNEGTFVLARGMLNTIPFRDVEYLPVTCSHTFAALNIIESGGRGLDERLCGDDGNIDQQKVLKLCPSWKKQ